MILVDAGTVKPVGLGPLAVGESTSRWSAPGASTNSLWGFCCQAGMAHRESGVGRNQGHRGTGVGSAGLYQ